MYVFIIRWTGTQDYLDFKDLLRVDGLAGIQLMVVFPTCKERMR